MTIKNLKLALPIDVTKIYLRKNKFPGNNFIRLTSNELYEY